jgi:hypothetical protein
METAAPAVATPSSRPSPEASPAKRTAAGTGSCSDPKGDSVGALDLTGVKLSRDGDEMVASFTNAKALPSTGAVLWSLMVSSKDGEKASQLGAKVLDNEEISHFVFDMRSVKQENLQPGGVVVTGKTMTTTFPLARITDLGPGAHWQADLNLEGNDVDSCPKQPTKALALPKTIDFPADWF